MNRFTLFFLIALCGLICMTREIHAQAQPGPGYTLRALDGVNRLGPHFAVLPRPHADTALGFVYLEDEGALYTGTCNFQCTPSARVASGADRGRHVSVDLRSGLNNRPFAAFYNASTGDLEALDCLNQDCSGATLRVLETSGDVGAGTSTAVDPVSGLPHIAYYDAGNGDLRLYRCANAVCDTGSSLLVDGGGDSGRAPVALFAHSRLLIAYQRDGDVWLASATAPYSAFSTQRVATGAEPVLTLWNGTAELLFRGAGNVIERRRCGDPACALLGNPGALSTAANGGRAPSARVLSDGRLFVAYLRADTADLAGLICADATCASPQSFMLQAGADTGQRVAALGYADGRPLALFDGSDHSIRSTQCNSTACSSFSRRVATNGLAAVRPRLALRSDGRAVAIWTRLRNPRMGLCSDAACSSVTYREPEGANSDSSDPAVAIRPDGRPIAFYSYVGGSAAWDCADVDCNSGTLRQIGGAGNGTGNHTELVIRPDGRPLMAYTRLQGATREVRVFSCDDANCSSGSERLIADESTGSTLLDGLSLTLGAGGRAVLAWNLWQGSSGSLRLAQCLDIDCVGSSVQSVNAAQTFFRVPLAVRGDGRPVLIENSNAGRRLLTCDAPACASSAASNLPNLFDSIGGLALDSGQRPIYSSGRIGVGGYWRCDDPACGSMELVTVITDAGGPNRGFSGPLALNAQNQPVLAFGEQDLADVWLATPLAPAIFSNGFE